MASGDQGFGLRIRSSSALDFVLGSAPGTAITPLKECDWLSTLM